jgi:hypothetical protein
MLAVTSNPQLRYMGLARASHRDEGGIYTMEYQNGSYLTVDFQAGFPVFATAKEALAAITPPTVRHKATQTSHELTQEWINQLQEQLAAARITDDNDTADQAGGSQE